MHARSGCTDLRIHRKGHEEQAICPIAEIAEA